MQLSELLGVRVHDDRGQRVGTVVDVRLQITGDLDDHPERPTLFGLVVSPRTNSSFLGYERSGVRGPAVLSVISSWRHRGTFLVRWAEVADLTEDGLRLRSGFTRWSPLLHDD